MKLKQRVDKNTQAQIEPDKQTSVPAPATEEGIILTCTPIINRHMPGEIGLT